MFKFLKSLTGGKQKSLYEMAQDPNHPITKRLTESANKTRENNRSCLEGRGFTEEQIEAIFLMASEYSFISLFGYGLDPIQKDMLSTIFAKASEFAANHSGLDAMAMMTEGRDLSKKITEAADAASRGLKLT